MAKRGRDDAPQQQQQQQQQQAKHDENPVKPAPPPKRCRDMTQPVGEGAAGNGRASLEKGRVHEEPDAKTWVASRETSTVSAQVVSLDEAGSAAPGELPRWWQLWVGMRGGGRVVDCEELLWGWFPFVDEDFSADGEKVGWLSIWGDELEGQQEDHIWQLKQMNQISSRSR